MGIGKTEARTKPEDFDEAAFDKLVVSMTTNANADETTISSCLMMRGRSLAKVAVEVKFESNGGVYVIKTRGDWKFISSLNRFMKKPRSGWVLIYHYITSKSFRKTCSTMVKEQIWKHTPQMIWDAAKTD